MPRPHIRIPTHQLRRDAEVRRREGCAAAGNATSLPAAMFGTCDPMVEATLVDNVVWQLLRHMSLDAARLPHGTTAQGATAAAGRGGFEENAITAQDIRALIDELGAGTAAAPDLLEHLPQERLWILLDLVREGSGLARQRATVELREAMQHLAEWEGVNQHVLRELIRLLDEASAERGEPVLFRALRIAAERALHTAGSD